MRSDKYSGKRDSSRDTQSYDGWEETQMLFQSRDQEKEAEKKRRQREAAYQEYLALRENPDASRAPEDDVRTYTRKKRANKQQSSVFEEPKPSRREKKEQKKPPTKKKKKKGRSLRRVILIVLLLLIAAAAAGILFVMGLMEKVGTEEIDQANLGINPQVEQDLSLIHI